MLKSNVAALEILALKILRKILRIPHVDDDFRIKMNKRAMVCRINI